MKKNRKGILCSIDLPEFTDTHYAETAAPVTITDANSTVKAIGMHAFLAEERIELLSAVRGVYVPQ